MMWAQSLAAFAVWIGLGLVLRAWQGRLRASIQSLPRVARVLLGSVGFLVSILVLFGGLYAIQALGGLKDGLLTAPAWIGVVIVGAAFIVLQVLGAGAMITLVQDEQREGAVKASKSSEGHPEA